jgi:hypothetical protein
MGEPTTLPRCRASWVTVVSRFGPTVTDRRHLGLGEAVAIGRLLSPAVRGAAKTIEAFAHGLRPVRSHRTLLGLP